LKKHTRAFHARLRQVSERLSEQDVDGAKRAFRSFWASSRRVWRGIAATLYQRWTPPTGYSIDDVEQDLSMEVWNLLVQGRYDAARGRTLADYIVFNACVRAKYQLHKHRGANLHGNSDISPTRAPRSFTSMGLSNVTAEPVKEDWKAESGVLASRMRTAATQEIEVDRRATLMRLLDCVSVGSLDDTFAMRGRFALVALFRNGGNEENASRDLYGAPVVRQLCRIGSEGEALRVVHHAVEAYTERYGFDEDAFDFDFLA
jgi:hypothetical protein